MAGGSSAYDGNHASIPLGAPAKAICAPMERERSEHQGNSTFSILSKFRRPALTIGYFLDLRLMGLSAGTLSWADVRTPVWGLR
jgi:hypothetical protein